MVYTLIQKSFGGLESEPMLTPRGKSPLPEKFSSDEDRTHNAASSRTASPHYQLSYSGPSINPNFIFIPLNGSSDLFSYRFFLFIGTNQQPRKRERGMEFLGKNPPALQEY